MIRFAIFGLRTISVEIKSVLSISASEKLVIEYFWQVYHHKLSSILWLHRNEHLPPPTTQLILNGTNRFTEIPALRENMSAITRENCSKGKVRMCFVSRLFFFASFPLRGNWLDFFFFDEHWEKKNVLTVYFLLLLQRECIAILLISCFLLFFTRNTSFKYVYVCMRIKYLKNETSQEAETLSYRKTS